MRNARPLVVIVTAVFLGLAAVLLAGQWVTKQSNLATVRVTVATQDLAAGTRITPEMVKVVEWPAASPLKDPIADAEKVKDRVVTASVLRGEPILAAKLAPPGETGGISAMLAEGKRAITVKVNEIAGVAGFALPGNYVDVLVSTSDEHNKAISKIVLERILVLAVAQQADSKDNKPRVVDAVTLEVTPQEAENIDLARSIGQLSLVLRNQLEPRGTATAGARKQDLLRLAALTVAPRTDATAEGKPAPAPQSAPPAPKRVVVAVAPKPAPEDRIEVIRGTKKTLETAGNRAND